jgi:hypothetical protein
VRRTLGVVLLTAAGLIPLRVIARPAQESLSLDRAIFLMRLVVSTEASGAPYKNGYLNLVNLVRDPEKWPDLSQRPQYGLPNIEVVDSNSGRILNYLVQITTSDDKKHFQASFEPIDPKTCSPAIFADDRGVFYVGKGLGCPASGPVR